LVVVLYGDLENSIAYPIAIEKKFNCHMLWQPNFFKLPNLVVIKNFGCQHCGNQTIPITTKGGNVICFWKAFIKGFPKDMTRPFSWKPKEFGHH
jgi:hypothetical protein